MGNISESLDMSGLGSRQRFSHALTSEPAALSKVFSSACRSNDMFDEPRSFAVQRLRVFNKDTKAVKQTQDLIRSSSPSQPDLVGTVVLE